MIPSKLRLDELLGTYESALGAAGLGYATRLRMLKCAGRLVNMHDDRGLEALSDDVIEEYFSEADEALYQGKVNINHYRERNRDIERFLAFAKNGTVSVRFSQKGSRFKLLPEFERIAEAFLASGDFHPNTRNDMRWVTHKYFAWLAEHDYDDLTGIGAEQIQKFMLDCSKEVVPNSMHNIRLYLKKLYAYLYAAQLSPSPYGELLSFKVNREHRIYPVLSRVEIEQLLAAIDRRSKSGKRAYAAMLLGSELGLRACDVVGLELGNIDWRRGEIKVVQAKTNNTVVLPLLQNVGEALQDYILGARPKTDEKRIFFKLQRPYAPLSSAVTVGEIFRDCCKAAGLPASNRFHTLRRSLATGMVVNGVDVRTVAQVLGDADVESTKPYIALDSVHLKRCALSFDGIVPREGGVA
jgi:site-specific recombinase XerD